MSRNDCPTLEKLSVKDMKTIFDIKTPADIRSTKLISEFEDDHIACANAKINDVKVALFWCGSKTVSALELDDSEKAKKVVFDALQAEIHACGGALFDRTDDDLKEEINENRTRYETFLNHVRSLRKNNVLRKEVMGYINGSTLIDQDLNLV